MAGLLGFMRLINLGFSRSAEVREVFGRFMINAWVLSMQMMLIGLHEALGSGDVSGAWVVWSSAAEGALVDTFCLAGGACPG